MKKWTYIYFAIALIWTACYTNLGGGEAGIVPFLITSVVTFPIGLIVWPVGHLIHGELFVPLMLILNYFQWVFFIKKFKKARARKLM